MDQPNSQIDNMQNIIENLQNMLKIQVEETIAKELIIAHLNDQINDLTIDSNTRQSNETKSNLLSQIADLQQKQALYVEQIIASQQQQDLLKNNQTNLEIQLQELTLQNNQLNRLVNVQKQQINDAQEQIKQQSNQESKSKINNLQFQYLESQVQELNNSLNLIYQEKCSIEKQKQILEEFIKSNQKELEKQNESLDLYKQQANQFQIQIEEKNHMIEQNKVVIYGYQSEIGLLNTKFELAENGFNQKIQDLQQKEPQRKELKERIQKLEKQMEMNDGEADQIKKNLKQEEQARKRKESENESLKREIENLKEQIVIHQRWEIEERKKDQELSTMNRGLKNELNQVKEMMIKEQKELEVLKIEKEQQKLELQGLQKMEIQNRQNELMQVQQKYDHQGKEMEKLQAQFAKEREKLKDWEYQSESLKRQYNDYVQESKKLLNKFENDQFSLQTQLTSTQSTLQHLNNSIIFKDQQIQSLKTQILQLSSNQTINNLPNITPNISHNHTNNHVTPTKSNHPTLTNTSPLQPSPNSNLKLLLQEKKQALSQMFQQCRLSTQTNEEKYTAPSKRVFTEESQSNQSITLDQLYKDCLQKSKNLLDKNINIITNIKTESYSPKSNNLPLTIQKHTSPIIHSNIDLNSHRRVKTTSTVYVSPVRINQTNEIQTIHQGTIYSPSIHYRNPVERQKMEFQKEIISYPDGSIYEGQILNRKKHGFGVLKVKDQELYSGQWQNDLFNGQGIQRNLNISGKLLKQTSDIIDQDCQWLLYQGQFREGSWNGDGLLLFSNGDKFKGQYYMGKAEGKGSYFSREGEQQGLWKQGIKIGVY